MTDAEPPVQAPALPPGLPAPEAADSPPRPRPPLFLERESYRRRRLMDAARLLPLFGGAMLLVPMFWSGGHRTSSGLVFLFAVWFAIILATGILAARLSAPLRKPERRGGG